MKGRTQLIPSISSDLKQNICALRACFVGPGVTDLKSAGVSTARRSDQSVPEPIPHIVVRHAALEVAASHQFIFRTLTELL